MDGLLFLEWGFLRREGSLASVEESMMQEAGKEFISLGKRMISVGLLK